MRLSRHRRLWWMGLCCLPTLSSVASADSVSAKHANVELVSKLDGIAPGSTAVVGVHFTLEPGWHIYWINPGDSGQPPELHWRLPDGFTAGNIEWPRPERLQSRPELADYGYHDGVLLMVRLHAPQRMPSKAVDIAAQAKWLICREVCLPDRAQLHLSLPVKSSPAPNPETSSSFNAAEKLVPKPWPHTWLSSVTSRQDEFILAVHTGRRESHAEFFPLKSPARQCRTAKGSAHSWRH